MTIAISGWVLGDDGFAQRTVLIEGNRIAAIGTTENDRAALLGRAAEHVEADDCWVIPGLIDAHAHGYATLLRGTENALPLELWALYTVLYGRAFNATAMRAAILLGAAERIRSGITGWIDHSPMMHLGEAALDAHARSGLRVGWAPFLHDVSDYALMDLKLPPEADRLAGRPAALDPVDYARRFGEFVQAPKPDRISVLLGPNAPQRCSQAAWALWRALRDRHGVAVHTHLMETRAQAVMGARWPGGLVAEMARQDLVDDRLSVAHGIWLTPDERVMLARAGVTLVHNPASNLMLGSGILPWNETGTAGLTMALGTDSANTGGRHDMFATMRLAMMLPRVSGLKHEQWPQETDVLAMATRNGAAVLGLRSQVGRIAPGQLADLVLVRRNAAAVVAFAPAEAVLVQHAGPEHVHAMIVDGQWVMREGRILAFDEEQVIGDAIGIIAEIRNRTGDAMSSISTIMPALSHSLGRFLC